MKFRKKPVIVDAIKWTGDNLIEVQDFGKAFVEITESEHFKDRLAIETSDGTITVAIDDWIVKDLKDEDENFIYSYKADIFVEKFAEYLHNAGLNAFTHPHSRSAEEWHEYREKIAKQLIEDGCIIPEAP